MRVGSQRKQCSKQRRTYVSLTFGKLLERNLMMVSAGQYILVLTVLALSSLSSDAFVPKQTASASFALNGIFDKVGEFFEELDAFVDDATSRRLGAGASFYGKRKSNFYGENDKGKKRDRNQVDPTEDYRGPTSTGLFEWRADENGQLQPVTRMKGKSLSKKVNWEKVYANDEK